jgi:photosystem II stability/assembly factor-like uncharacterized protein
VLLVIALLSIAATTVADTPFQGIIPGTWVPQGPGPTLNGEVEHIPGDNPVIGAVKAIVADPNHADIIYIGAVNGGVWKTTNATAASPNWTPLTDQFPSLSIGALEMDPTDPTNQTLVAGIGKFSSFKSSGVRQGGALTGLLRTTNGGHNWTQLGQDPLHGLQGRNVSGVGPRGNTILVSVNTGTDPGMYRSTDGGATFTFISGMNGLPLGPVFDLVGDPDPGNQNRFYTGIGRSMHDDGGVFRTDDAGATWMNVTDATIGALIHESLFNLQPNIKLAVHNNANHSTNAVYVGIVINGLLAGLFRSADKGGTWTEMDLPQTMEEQSVDCLHFTPDHRLTHGNICGIHPGEQGDKDFSIVADPTNAYLVYMGGDRQPGDPLPSHCIGDEFSVPNSIGANKFSGRLFRGDASLPRSGEVVPSPQWTALTHNGTASNSSPHADSRKMVFDADGNIVDGDDGGIYMRTYPQNNTGDWFSLIGNLQIGEVHHVAYDDVSKVIIGATWDNGVTEQTASGSPTWRMVCTGDGSTVAVDNATLFAGGQSIRYSSISGEVSGLNEFQKRIFDARNNQVGKTELPTLTLVGSGLMLGSQNITPLKLNAINPARLVIAGGGSIYESLDQGDHITEIVGMDGSAVVRLGSSNALAYGGRRLGENNEDVLYVGKDNSVWRRAVAQGTLQRTLFPPDVGTINDIVMDPNDWPTAYVVVSSDQVFQTTDGGVIWNNITGDIQLGGAANFRTVRYVSRNGNDMLVVGTTAGVRVSFKEPGFNRWLRLGFDLPNAPVWNLEYDTMDDVLVAGTLGRGVWALKNVSTVHLLASDNSIQPANSPAESFTPCFSPGPCPVKKTVTFTLPALTEVFITYDLGQSHGCCDDHVVGLLRILLNATEVTSDRIPFFNYGVAPISEFLEDFDYFFPSEVVMGRQQPVSRLDPGRVGPILQNYKTVQRFSLGTLAAGSYTVELQIGDAGWNSIFEIYTLE